MADTIEKSAIRDPASRAWASTRSFLATRRGKLIAGGTAAVLIVGAGGGAVFAATRGDDSRYRTATAELGQVAETLSLTGQVSSGTSASAAFQVSGTVGEVLVKLGDPVTAGQKLASLDLDDLEAAVTDAEDAVASAKQQLEDDLDAQSSGTTSSTGSTSGGSGGSGSVPEAGSGASSGPGSGGSGSGSGSSASDDPAVVAAAKAVSDAQDALLAQYDVTTAAREASSTAAANAQEVCKPFLDADLTDDGTVSSDDTQIDGGTDSSASQDLLKACQAAISDTLDKQETTSNEQETLNDKAKALDAAVTALQQAIAAAEGSSTATSSYRTNGSTGLTVTTASYVTAKSAADTGSGSMGGSSTQSTTITSEQILADRAQIDLAKAQLAIAKQDLGFGTLSSPIAGEVVSIALAAGDSVSAGSTSAVITVQGAGGYVVQSTVSLSKIAKVAVGQSASVTLPAFAATYDATVTTIGVLNSSSTSTPSYTVTLSIDTDDDLRIGATAQATVSLSTAKDVLTVPTSAVTISGSQASVVELKDGEAETVKVTVGAIGSERTEITKGLDEGDTVVLADLTKSITSGDDSSSGSLSDLGGSSQQGPGGISGGSFPGGGSFPDGGSFRGGN